MDKTMLRHQALNLAMSRAIPGMETDDVLKEAGKILSWLLDEEGDAASSSPSAQHESAAAVEGQEPKGA